MEKIIKPEAWSDVDMSNPCDLSNLRLSQSDAVGVKKLLTTVRVHKPEKQDFIRVHPDEKYRVDIPMILLKDDREFYAIGRNMVSELASEANTYTLFTTVNRQGVFFLWPIRLPDADGKDNEWYRSAREAAAIAVGG